jgi:hypothetical protein
LPVTGADDYTARPALGAASQSRAAQPVNPGEIRSKKAVEKNALRELRKAFAQGLFACFIGSQSSDMEMADVASACLPYADYLTSPESFASCT